MKRVIRCILGVRNNGDRRYIWLIRRVMWDIRAIRGIFVTWVVSLNQDIWLIVMHEYKYRRKGGAGREGIEKSVGME